MSAEPVPEYIPEPPAKRERGQEAPCWPVPPEGGFTAEDLDRLPQLPAHTELIDGSLVFVSPQANFHMLTVSLLENTLRRLAPAELRVRREMTVTLAKRQRPEPDVLVLRAEAVKGPEQSNFAPEDVVLAVEVVSPESVERDRERKPQLYAKAGIQHFWRVENIDGRPAVFVYELDPATAQYGLAGVHHDRLKLTVPFDIDIDLTEIDRL
ncbi:Uma2 family endonuclease [Actinomadura hibisca]|uniref:Uma2 family endonuclease n=1 Tax=Actinomadura hibisca TaxID=68565 RepID=UPI0009FD118D